MEHRNIYDYVMKEKGLDRASFDALPNSVKDDYADAFMKLKNELSEKKMSELKDELEKKAADEKAALEAQIKVLSESIDRVKVDIKKDMERDDLPFKKRLENAFEENKEALSKGRLEEGKPLADVVIKVAGTITTGNISGGSVPQEQYLPGVGRYNLRAPRLLDIIPTMTATSPSIRFVDQRNRDSQAGQTAEGALKNQQDYDLVVTTENIEKSSTSVDISMEMLDDISYMSTMVQEELLRELRLVLETQAYSGNGTSPNQRGLNTVATTFAAGSFADQVSDPSNLDVLTVALRNIRVDQEGNSDPNYILLHPNEVADFMLKKVSATDERYNEKLFNVGNTLMVGGLTVIPTTLVSAGEFLIGDFTKAVRMTKGGLSISFGYVADNFKKNIITVLGETRAATLVRLNDRGAFQKGTFATAKTALSNA